MKRITCIALLALLPLGAFAQAPECPPIIRIRAGLPAPRLRPAGV